MNRKIWTRWQTVLLLVGAVSGAQAAVCPGSSTITSNGEVCVDGTTATAILGIGIDPDGAGGDPATYYDVMFESLLIPSTAGTGDVFENDSTAAEAAAIAIGAALDETVATAVGTTSAFSYLVPYEFGTSACGDMGTGTCSWDGLSPLLSAGWESSVAVVEHNTGTGPAEFARFTVVPAPVPLPPAALLFGSGLSMLLLGLRRRRRAMGT